MNRTRAIVTAVLALLAVACASAPSSPQRSTSKPAAAPVYHAPTGTGSAGSLCYLISDSEITGIMGQAPLSGGSGFELGGMRTCNWIMAFSPMASAGLSLFDVSDFSTLGDQVSGIGDDAYWLTGGDQLSVKYGRYALIASATSPKVDSKAAATQIAQLAMSRLPR